MADVHFTKKLEKTTQVCTTCIKLKYAVIISSKYVPIAMLKKLNNIMFKYIFT